jgi:hypothetical protein
MITLAEREFGQGQCIDCGCPMKTHTINWIGEWHIVAHCGNCGTCWRTKKSTIR